MFFFFDQSSPPAEQASDIVALAPSIVALFIALASLIFQQWMFARESRKQREFAKESYQRELRKVAHEIYFEKRLAAATEFVHRLREQKRQILIWLQKRLPG